MSRSGYVEDMEDQRALAMYRGVVANVIRSKRGQAFLKELADAMDAMPEKILIHGELINREGNCCAVGVVCKARGVDVTGVDFEEPEQVAAAVGIAKQMAAEIEFENDEGCWRGAETPGERWIRMRKWVGDQIKKEQPAGINHE